MSLQRSPTSTDQLFIIGNGFVLGKRIVRGTLKILKRTAWSFPVLIPSPYAFDLMCIRTN